ncbi:MAG TPA: protein adenylyltransferase SelO family protein, partial [Vampirovibrionales bacterium]
SHIRFGHFEHFYHKGQTDEVRVLANYVIDNHFPDLKTDSDKYFLWFKEVVKLTAKLIASWQSAGFAHGVMNTDNMSILGLTLDYGPFGFLEQFQPEFICNHSDEMGRYAFNQQPQIALWNLNMLAFTLQPLFSFEDAKIALNDYQEILVNEYSDLMALKLGIQERKEKDVELWKSLFPLMKKHKSDYTNTFRTLSRASEANKDDFLLLFNNDLDMQRWLEVYLERVSGISNRKEIMLLVNPKYILRNWVAEKVIRAVEDKDDYVFFDKVFHVLKAPFDEHEEFEELAALAPEEYQHLSVSCSS